MSKKKVFMKAVHTREQAPKKEVGCSGNLGGGFPLWGSRVRESKGTTVGTCRGVFLEHVLWFNMLFHTTHMLLAS